MIRTGGDVRIEGDRIYLRTLTADDAGEQYLAWMNDPRVNRYLETRFVEQNIASLRTFVESTNADPNNLLTGIFLRDGDRHIGNIKLGPINVHHRCGDIGLLIGDPTCWGHGFATEAIAIMTRHAFEKLDLHQVGAGAYAVNEGSVRAFERVGFRREGLLKERWRTDEGRVDGVILGMVNPALAGR